MTESSGTDTSCPACGAIPESSEQEALSGVCQECGLVQAHADADISESGKVSMTDSNQMSETDGDWTDSVEVRDSTDEQLVSTLGEVDALASELAVSADCRVAAADLMGECWRQNLLHGRSVPAIAGAVLYVVCRREGTARPIGAVAAVADVDTRSLTNAYQVVRSELEIDLAPSAPSDYVEYLYSTIALEGLDSRRTDAFLETGSGSTGNPVGIAAAAVYLAAHEADIEVTLREVAEAAGLTKETIWRHSRHLRETQGS